MAKKTIVHVVGTGTIGEPLIGLFTDFKEKWGIDEVTFHKRTPKPADRPVVNLLVETLALRDGKLDLRSGRFVCMRRANDISDVKSFLAAPEAGKHDDPEFGTHHARDSHHLFATLGERLDLYSSAIKINTQYMH